MPHLSIPHHRPQLSALLVLAASLLGPSVTAFSAEVRLAWDAPAQTGLAGYKIYYGVSGKGNVTRIDIGNVTTYTVTGLKTNTTYNFCVTAFYRSGSESICSNQVSMNVWPRMYGFDSPVIAKPSKQHNPTSEEPVTLSKNYLASALKRPLSPGAEPPSRASHALRPGSFA